MPSAGAKCNYTNRLLRIMSKDPEQMVETVRDVAGGGCRSKNTLLIKLCLDYSAMSCHDGVCAFCLLVGGVMMHDLNGQSHL